jgi:hypothetical protein
MNTHDDHELPDNEQNRKLFDNFEQFARSTDPKQQLYQAGRALCKFCTCIELMNANDEWAEAAFQDDIFCRYLENLYSGNRKLIRVIGSSIGVDLWFDWHMTDWGKEVGLEDADDEEPDDVDEFWDEEEDDDEDSWDDDRQDAGDNPWRNDKWRGGDWKDSDDEDDWSCEDRA